MKIRVINIFEIILGIVFFIGLIAKVSISADSDWLAIIAAFLLSILYFPLGFYTLKSNNNINVANRFLYGMIFSFSISSVMLSLMQIDLSIIFLIIFIAGFFILAVIKAVLTYLFNEYKVLDYDNGIAARFLILFCVMVYSLIRYTVNLRF